MGPPLRLWMLVTYLWWFMACGTLADDPKGTSPATPPPPDGRAIPILLPAPTTPPPNPSGLKRMIFKILGIGKSAPLSPPPQMLGPYGPCPLPWTTTTTTPSPIVPWGPCAYPPIGPDGRPFPLPLGPNEKPFPVSGLGPGHLPLPIDPSLTLVNPPLPINPDVIHPQPIDPIHPHIVDPIIPVGPNPAIVVVPNPVTPSPPLVINPSQVGPIDPIPVFPDHVSPGTPLPIYPINPVTPLDPTLVNPVIPHPHGTDGGHVGPGIPSQSLVTERPFVPPPRPYNNATRPLPCSCLKPFVPHGFSYASIIRYMDEQYEMLNPALRDPAFVSREPPCSVLEALRLLGANRMRNLILQSDAAQVFMALSGYTLFVPPDVAFDRLPIWLQQALEVDSKLRLAVVLNHFVKIDYPLGLMENENLVLNDRPGPNRLRINVYFEDFLSPIYSIEGSKVIRGDIVLGNGRVHLVDKVIIPNIPRTAAEYLSERSEFEVFWNMVKNTNLHLFQNDRPITVFIPINAAIEVLGVQELLSDPVKLNRFVSYHVVNGTYYSPGLLNGQYLMTNYLKEIKVGIKSDTYAKYLTDVNGHVRIIKSDIPLTNGVAHIISECLTEDPDFILYPDIDPFPFEYGVISKRAMKITGEEKFLDF